MNMIIEFIKSLFCKDNSASKNLPPITRYELLCQAEHETHETGICSAIKRALEHNGLDDFSWKADLDVMFPKFTLENAKQFHTTGTIFWWKPGEWNTGRQEFVDWLKEQYKDDTKNAREIADEWLKDRYIEGLADKK